MSEFKYACPVCGQHMKCDSSQSGTVMECPTCFQKIIAPQAPDMDDPKFIITGTKVGERPIPKAAGGNPSVLPVIKNAPQEAVVFVVIVLGLIGVAAAAFVFRGTLFKSSNPPPVVKAVATNRVPAKAKAPVKPVVVAPPANDTNWMLSLNSVAIPDSPACGRVHGVDFICDRVTLQGDMLMMHGPMNLSVMINFPGVQPEALAGKSLNVTTNATVAAHVILGWKEGDQGLREFFTNGYAMRLDFGELEKNHIAGKIYLCTADAGKSYVAGNFNAEIRKSRPKQKK
jgi:DNA-directed RNA polymerase subunit RPC12/RpoP